MHVGLGLITCQRYPGDSRSDLVLYREALEIAEYAEELGFDSVWTSEHHFADDAYMPSLLPTMAAIAARTSRIQIGSAVVLAPLFHPLRLAEDAATVDLISGNRLVLGLGLGWLAWQFNLLGVDLAKRVAITVETIEILRQAWGLGLIDHHGPSFEISGVQVTPKPSRSGGPPIWLGGEAPAAVRRAGAIADGWLTDMPMPDEFERQLEQLAGGIQQASRAPDDVWVGGIWPTFVARSFEAGWSKIGGYFSHRVWKSADYRIRPGNSQLQPAPAPSQAELNDLRRRLITGDAEAIRDRIAVLRSLGGPQFVYIARLLYPGLPLKLQRDAIRRFAIEVMAELQAIPPRSETIARSR